jgi:hypothetical protein
MTDTLFKFATAKGAIEILKKGKIFVTSPLDLNDPFEMRPAMLDEKQQDLKGFLEKRGESFPSMGINPLNRTIGLSDRANKNVFKQLHERFRVLSWVSGLMNPEKNYDESKKNRF